jgi:hypothetical protein
MNGIEGANLTALPHADCAPNRWRVPPQAGRMSVVRRYRVLAIVIALRPSDTVGWLRSSSVEFG